MGVELQAAGRGRQLGRYMIYDEIASGGMATVHVGRLVGPVGFSRTVAIKRLHPQYAKDAEFVSMFLDEARIAARVRHPNVVPTVDIVQEDGEIFLVMEYVQGESLSRLVKKSAARQELPPPPIVAWIVAGILHGLHAAHEARSEQGEPLHIVHRDVSPQNILVGVDGTARLLDFGVAKAAERTQTTRAGQVKGKIAYMSPEQISTDQIDRRTDIYAAGVVLWEALTGMRLFQGASEGRVVHLIMSGQVRPPSELVPGLDPIFDAITLKALASDPNARYASAREMAMELEQGTKLATPTTVGAWVESLAGELLHERAGLVAEIESRSDVFVPPQDPDASSGIAVRPSSDSFPAAPAANDEDDFGDATIAEKVAVPSIPAPPATTTSAPSVLDPSEVTFAKGDKWKKPATIAAVVLGFAALCVIFAALMSALRTPRAVVAQPEPPKPTAVSTERSVAAEPPLTTRATASAAPTHPEKVLVLPSATVTPRTRTNVPAPPAPNCNPPYSVDKQGIRHPKPECL